MRFYAEALDRSDYAAAAATTLHALLGVPASLLDIGAGAGHPVAAWLPPATRWTAVEPNRYLRARLGRLRRRTHPALRVVDATWEALPDLPPHAVALAANIGGPLSAPRALLPLMRARATRAVAWNVPAQHGPRRWCLAGALPPHLHREDERPGVSLVLEAVTTRPSRSAVFPWTFRARFADLAAAEAHENVGEKIPQGAVGLSGRGGAK